MGNIVGSSENDEYDGGLEEVQNEYNQQSHHMTYSTSTGLPMMVPQQVAFQSNMQPQQQLTPLMQSSMPSMPSHFVLNGSSMQNSSVGSPATWGNDYPLHHAAATGAPTSELNRLVVHEGLDVDEVDHTGSTPLHLAVYYGHEHCAKWLLNKGRARYLKDSDGNTPADLARQSGNVSLAELIEGQMNSSSVSGMIRSRSAGSGGSGNQAKEEQLYLELDRAHSKIAALKASEKRARQELANEVAERVKLFRVFVNKNTAAADAEASPVASQLSAVDIIEDMRMQIVEFKSQRDALAAEVKLVEETLGDLELLLTGSKMKSGSEPGGLLAETTDYVSPSVRLRACLRKI